MALSQRKQLGEADDGWPFRDGLLKTGLGTIFKYGHLATCNRFSSSEPKLIKTTCHLDIKLFKLYLSMFSYLVNLHLI